MRALVYHVCLLLALTLQLSVARADAPPDYPFIGHAAGMARAKAENKPNIM